MKIRRWVRLRFLIINGHVGIGLVHGALRILLRRFPLTDVILIQEGRHIDKWRSDLGGKFEVWPRRHPGDQPMTYVAVRKSRFEILETENKNIRHNGQYERELDAVVVRDRKSGQKLSLSSFHVDPLGKGFERASASARKAQIDQTGEFVAWHDEQPAEVLPFSGGDTNNWLPTTTGRGSVRYQFSDIGMTPLFTHKKGGKVDLMDLFARFGSKVKAVRRVSTWVHVEGMDHPCIYAVVKVRKA